MKFTKNSITMRVSRDTLLMHGLVEPTADEQRERDALHREYEERRRIANMVIPAAIHRLDELDDNTSRTVLDLHARSSSYGSGWHCDGCDQGCSCDSAEWPCSTVKAIAGLHRIDMTDADLFRRPSDGSLDLTSHAAG